MGLLGIHVEHFSYIRCMFYLQIIQDDKVVQSRVYTTAHECTEKMLVAFDYYIGHQKEPVKIRMCDNRMMLIKEIDSEKGLDL